MSLPRILKLIRNRPLRRLELIHRGYVEPVERFGGSVLPVMAAWGWMEYQEPVHWLDAYDGYRPTKAGLEHLHYDEAHHLIVIRPSKAEGVAQRYMKHLEVQVEAAMVNLSAEIALAKARGWTYEKAPGAPAGTDEAVARMVHRGYEPLEAFNRRHDVSQDELVVAGVLRYAEGRKVDSLARLTIGPKAKHCLMHSARWHQIYVRPGMSEALLALVNIEEA